MGRVFIHPSVRRSLRFGLRAAALVLVLGPAGCAVGVGGGDNSVAGRQGKFVDSTVEGLEFNAGGLIGTTDETGRFFYDSGTPVTFYVGDIVVGTGPGAALMTPLSLVEAAVDETNGTVTNIVRFLLTIDDDRDPDNGIQISDAVRAAARGLSIDFTFPPSTFAGNNNLALGTLSAATQVGGATVSELTAQEHLRVTLLALLAGTYGGDYTGDDAGTWSIEIDTEGNVTASSVSTVTADAFSMTGSVESNGHGLTFSVTSGPKFDGAISSNGVVTGRWQRLLPGDFGGGTTAFGDFTGFRES